MPATVRRNGSSSESVDTAYQVSAVIHPSRVQCPYILWLSIKAYQSAFPGI